MVEKINSRVTLEELHNIILNSCMTDDMEQTRDVWQHYWSLRDPNDIRWSFYKALFAVYTAGKVDGIRTERRRRTRRN